MVWKWQFTTYYYVDFSRGCGGDNNNTCANCQGDLHQQNSIYNMGTRFEKRALKIGFLMGEKSIRMSNLENVTTSISKTEGTLSNFSNTESLIRKLTIIGVTS